MGPLIIFWFIKEFRNLYNLLLVKVFFDLCNLSLFFKNISIVPVSDILFYGSFVLFDVWWLFYFFSPVDSHLGNEGLLCRVLYPCGLIFFVSSPAHVNFFYCLEPPSLNLQGIFLEIKNSLQVILDFQLEVYHFFSLIKLAIIFVFYKTD